MEANKTVLFLHDSSGMYGAESVILSLGKALEKTGYHVLAGCLMQRNRKKPLLGKVAEAYLKVRYFPMRTKFDPLLVRQIRKTIRDMNVRLIHCHGYKSNLFGLISAKMSQIPIITTNHLFPPMPLDDKKLQIYSKFDVLFTMKRLNKIVAVSEDISTRLSAAGLNKSKIVVIENGIDLDIFRIRNYVEINDLKRSIGVDNNSFVIGTVGRLSSQKAQGVLLEATKKLLHKTKLIKVVIAGDGPLESQLKSYAEHLGVTYNVRFLGFRSDIADLLQAMDVFVLTSIDEGLPMAMLEAMAMKIPVIATEVGDIPKVLKNMENGILVKPGDSDFLANRIEYLISDKHSRLRLSANAFAKVIECYSKEAMCRKYCEVYEDVIISN